MKKNILQIIAKIKQLFSKFYEAWILGVCMFAFLCLGMWFDYMSHTTSDRNMPIEEFAQTLSDKEETAYSMLNYLYKSSIDQISNERAILKDELITIEKARSQGIEYLVYNDTVLKFWTGNEINSAGFSSFPKENEFYYRASNYHCVGIRMDITNSTFIALIKIKTAKLHENMHHESYVYGFEMPNHVNILSKETQAISYPIYAKDKTHLFNIEKVPYQQPNKLLKNLCGFSWAIYFILLTLLLKKLYSQRQKNRISKKRYVVGVGTLLLFVLFGSFIKQPLYIFNSSLFTPAYYHTEYASSLGIIVVYTIIISVFYYIVLRKKVTLDNSEHQEIRTAILFKSILLQVSAATLAILLYKVCEHFIDNSKINIAVAYIQDLTLPSAIALIIIGAWYTLLVVICQQLILTSIKPFDHRGRILMGSLSMIIMFFASFNSGIGISHLYGIAMSLLFGYLGCSYSMLRLPKLIHIIICSLAVVNLSVGLSIDFCDNRNHRNFTNLSKEISQGKLLHKDSFAEEYIAKAAEIARHDVILRTYLKDTIDRSADAEQYIRENYLKNYWEKYEVDVQIVPKNGDLRIRTSLEESVKRVISQKYLFSHACKIQKYTDFYLNEDIRLPYSYIGKLKGDPVKKNEIVFILYPSKKYRQILSANVNSKYANYTINYEEISVAKYIDYKLQMWTGKYPFPPSTDQLRFSSSKSYRYPDGKYNLYVTEYERGGKVVVANLAKASNLQVMLTSTIFCAFFFLLMGWNLVYCLMNKKIRKSIFFKSQSWMMSLMTILFAFMIIFCVKFFNMQYAMQQRMKMTQRTMGVQSFLMQQIGYRNTIKFESPDWYQVLLQNFGNVMKATLILYDKDGYLYAASNQEVMIYGSKKIDNTRHLMLPEAKFPALNNGGFPYFESIGNKDYQVLYLEVVNEYNVRVGYVQLLDTITGTSDKTPVFNFIIILTDIFLCIVIIALFCVWFINRRIAKPLEQVTSRMKEFNLKAENIKIPHKNSDDEIGILISRYNILIDKIRESAKILAKNERDAAWREMARSIAHEIKNPLTPIKLNIQLAQKKYEEDPENFARIFPRTCDRIIEQIDNLTQIATDFSDFAKVSTANHTKLDVLRSLRNVAELYAVNPEGVILRSEIPDDETAFIMGEEKQLYQIFNNLIKNAIQSIPDGGIGVITLNTEKTDSHIIISIQDNGCGIAVDNAEKIFQPNFTTKNSGTGLGLAISKSIIENSGGMIWYESTIGEGTTFFVQLPLSNE